MTTLFNIGRNCSILFKIVQYCSTLGETVYLCANLRASFKRPPPPPTIGVKVLPPWTGRTGRGFETIGSTGLGRTGLGSTGRGLVITGLGKIGVITGVGVLPSLQPK